MRGFGVPVLAKDHGRGRWSRRSRRPDGGAGALSRAEVGLVLSGGNIDVRMLASILVRGLEREDKIISLRLVIDDQPGMLGRVATSLGDAGANILEVSHRRMFLDVPAKGITLDVMIETKDARHAAEIIAKLQAKGFSVFRLNA